MLIQQIPQSALPVAVWREQRQRMRANHQDSADTVID